MTAYTGDPWLNRVGTTGVLLVYPYVDNEDECISIFYFDEGWDIAYVRHSRSRYSIESGIFFAKSVRSGSEKTYDISNAVELSPEVFQVDNFSMENVPEEWREIYLGVFVKHAWKDKPIAKVGKKK